MGVGLGVAVGVGVAVGDGLGLGPGGGVERGVGTGRAGQPGPMPKALLQAVSALTTKRTTINTRRRNFP
jgi:hypothetical protein